MSDEVKIEATEASAAKPAVKPKPKARRGKRVRVQSPIGCAYIQATYNNTIVTLTDVNGNTISWSSAGHNGFKGPKKATPYAASVIVRDAVEKAKDSGLKEVNVFLSGVGQGREGALRALNANGLTVLTIKDITAVPHNGCRPPRPRRV